MLGNDYNNAVRYHYSVLMILSFAMRRKQALFPRSPLTHLQVSAVSQKRPTTSFLFDFKPRIFAFFLAATTDSYTPSERRGGEAKTYKYTFF